MIKIGAHVSSAGGPVNAIKNILDIDGNCLQIFAGSPRMWARSLYPQSQVELFNKQVDEINLRPVFIHALYLVNLATDNKELLQKSTKSLLIDLQNGDSINAAGVVVHLGSHQERGFDSSKAQIVSEVIGLLEQTKTTPFLIENSAGQKGKIGSFNEIRELIKMIDSPRVGICLDTAHAFMAGYDLTSPQKVDLMVEELSELELVDKIKCIHLNDSKTKLGSTHDQHANLGEGYIGINGLKNFVNNPAFKDLPFVLEVPGDGNGPNKESLAVARSLFTGI